MIPSRYDWDFQNTKRDLIINDKSKLISMYINDALKKILKMFKYSNLPKTISQRTLELFILSGCAKVFKKGNNIYCGVGELSGVFTEDFLPSISTLVNIGLNYSKVLNIVPKSVLEDEDELNKIKSKIEDYCVVIPNDELYDGLMEEIYHYAEIQAEHDLSIKYALYNARIPSISVTNDDETKTSFDKYYDDIVNGKNPKSVMGSEL